MHVNCDNCSRRMRVKKSVRHNLCKCGYEFSHLKTFGRLEEVYLVDACVFIYTINREEQLWRDCETVLINSRYKLGTTKLVSQEVGKTNGYAVCIYNVPRISSQVDELKSNTSEPLSLQDKSLIQCAIDHPEIRGIITYDGGISAVVTKFLIGSDNDFFVGTATEFVKRKLRYFKNRNNT